MCLYPVQSLLSLSLQTFPLAWVLEAALQGHFVQIETRMISNEKKIAFVSGICHT